MTIIIACVPAGEVSRMDITDHAGRELPQFHVHMEIGNELREMPLDSLLNRTFAPLVQMLKNQAQQLPKSILED